MNLLHETKLWVFLALLTIILVGILLISKWYLNKRLQVNLSQPLKNKILRSIGFFVVLFILNTLLLSKDNPLHDYQLASNFIMKCSSVLILMALFNLLSIVLDCILDIYSQFKVSKKMPIQAMIQAIKVILILVFGFGIVAVFMDQNPLAVMGSVSTIAAFISFIFKDILLGFFAGAQLTFNHTVELGDFIEIPALSSKGTITSIGLTTVTIQNADESISTLPAFSLISNPLINYRHIYESGHRQISHRLYLKIKSESVSSFQQLIHDIQDICLSHAQIDKNKPIFIDLQSEELAGLPLNITCYVSIIDLSEFIVFKSQLITQIVECAQKQGFLG